MTEYTERVEGYQIRDVSYFGTAPADAPIRFDIVKWVQEKEPREILSMWTDEKGRWHSGKKISTEYCYSVGTLEWNSHEPCFEFESVGLRWLEENPSQRVIDMIIKFCKEKEKEILDKEGW